jgi:hypothetical protein
MLRHCFEPIRQVELYFEYAGTNSTAPVLLLTLVFLICRSCFLDIDLSVVLSFDVFKLCASFFAFSNSFSARRFSFSKRRSFFSRIACTRSSVNCFCSSNTSFRCSFSACRCSQDFVKLFAAVRIKLEDLCVATFFQLRPETLRPLTMTFGFVSVVKVMVQDNS